MVRDFPANGLRKSIFSLTFGYMHMDRWRFYWKSKSSFPIGSWSCCFSAVYVEMFGALPKPVPQDLQLQTRCQNKNDRRHSWSWWAGCSCEHLLAGKWDETPKTTKTTKGLTSPKNSRKKILQVYIYIHTNVGLHGLDLIERRIGKAQFIRHFGCVWGLDARWRHVDAELLDWNLHSQCCAVTSRF